MSDVRKAEMYGEYGLSIQASKTHYCTPRMGDGTWPLEMYSEVEVAIIPGLRLPSEIGIDHDLDELFRGDTVAGWVSWPHVDRLRAAMRERNLAIEAGK